MSIASPARNRQIAELQTVVLICLFVSMILWTVSYRGLYADGSHLLLSAIADRDFHHASETRITSTFLTQLPVVLAMRFGSNSMAMLAKLYTAGLAAIPVSCYALSIWIARREPVLVSATVAVIVCCFYPLCFLLVGEGNVYLALFWLTFTLLMSESADAAIWDIVILLISIAAVEVYETSALFSAILALLTAWRASKRNAWLLQIVGVAAATFFLAGAACGVSGIVFPRDAGNVSGFMDAIRRFPENGVYLHLLAIMLLSVIAAFVRGPASRVALGATLLGATIVFGIQRFHASGQLALGYVVYQRAQVYCTLLAVVTLVAIARLLGKTAEWPSDFRAAFLLPPLVAAFVLDTTETVKWSGFVDRMCRELSDGNSTSRAEFFAEPATRAYGALWTFPTMSLLLESKSNHVILQQPDYHGWQPFDPHHAPMIGAFKIGETICR